MKNNDNKINIHKIIVTKCIVSSLINATNNTSAGLFHISGWFRPQDWSLPPTSTTAQGVFRSPCQSGWFALFKNFWREECFFWIKIVIVLLLLCLLLLLLLFSLLLLMLFKTFEDKIGFLVACSAAMCTIGCDRLQ